jgi:hypothetical protein
LRDPRVVALLSEKFRCAWKKVGTFTVVEDRGVVVEKQGGSVAAYFGTPDGRVLGAALGAVDAGFFLEEARWAVEHAGRITSAAHAARSEDLSENPNRGAAVFS